MKNVNLLDHLISEDIDPRRTARSLYWAGYRIKRIAELLNEKANTIQYIAGSAVINGMNHQP